MGQLEEQAALHQQRAELQDQRAAALEEALRSERGRTTQVRGGEHQDRRGSKGGDGSKRVDKVHGRTCVSAAWRVGLLNPCSRMWFMELGDRVLPTAGGITRFRSLARMHSVE